MNVRWVGLKCLPCSIELNLYCQEANIGWSENSWVRNDRPQSDTANSSFVSFSGGRGLFISMEQIWRLTQEAAPHVLDPGCSSKNKTLMLWQVKPTSLPIRSSDLHFWLMSVSKGTCPPASTALGIGIILCKNVTRGRDRVPTGIMGVRVLTCHSEPDAWQGAFIWATPHGGPGWIQSYICTNSRPPRTQCALPARASFQDLKHWFWTPALSWDAQYL